MSDPKPLHEPFLKRAAAGGVRWTSVSTASGIAVRMVQLVVLARLLPPEVFGLMAMMLVVMEICGTVSQLGLSQAIIQRRDPKAEELASLYWLNFASGAMMYAVLWAITPLVVLAYNESQLQSMLSYAGLVFLISPFGALHRTLLHKSLRFKALAGLEISGALIGFVVVVALAVQGYGVWSLIWSQLVTAAWVTAGAVVLGRELFRPRLHFRWNDLDGYLRFGLQETGAMTLNAVNSRLDRFLVGVLFGAEPLGFYNMALNLVVQPVYTIGPILTRVAFPVLSRVQDDNERMKRGWFTMLKVISSIQAPILVGIAVAAPSAIPLVLGERWTPIVPLVQILAFYALIRSFGNAAGSMILAKGRTDMSLYWNLLETIVMPLVIFLAAYFGSVVTLAWALLGTHATCFVAFYLLITRPLLGPCLGGYLRAVGIPVLMSGGMAASVLVVNRLLSAQPQLTLLVAEVATGVLTYTALYLLFDRASLREHLRLFLARA